MEVNVTLKLQFFTKRMLYLEISYFQQAFGEICLLWLNIAGCVYTFYPINKLAAGLMLPYLGWVTLATALTYTIWQMNKPAIKEE